MINPEKISNFNLTVPELEENILFWVCAAGKNGVTAAKCLEKFLAPMRERFGDLSPFMLIYQHAVPIHPSFQAEVLGMAMNKAGIGCHTSKSKTFLILASSAINLKTCSVDELMDIKGIGPKTARAFLVHTREAQKFAVIDTHLLKFFRHQGIIAPKSTPTGKKYNELERAYLKICFEWGLESADLDLAIWNHYRKTPDVVFDIGKFADDYHQRKES